MPASMEFTNDLDGSKTITHFQVVLFPADHEAGEDECLKIYTLRSNGQIWCRDLSNGDDAGNKWHRLD